MKSGFVNIIGKPNAGKSTLMNAMIGERMSIITHKPQTTRHRILGILTKEEEYQIVFSDTPGYVQNPSYQMHEAMNTTIEGTLEDADILLFLFDASDPLEEENAIVEVLKKAKAPMFLVINKIDRATTEQTETALDYWSSRLDFKEKILVSAQENQGLELLFERLIEHLPERPFYYPEDQLTDRSERFFVSEIIREKILLLYKEEVPYSAEVVVESFKEDVTRKGEPLIRIAAMIYVLRETQKMILLGKGGSSIKQLGMEARKSIEGFLQSKVLLELTVKVRKDWRNDETWLKRFGY